MNNIYRIQGSKEKKPSIYSVDGLEGHSFEYFCADMLKNSDTQMSG